MLRSCFAALGSISTPKMGDDRPGNGPAAWWNVHAFRPNNKTAVVAAFGSSSDQIVE
jgi:hypothetical protein